MDEKKGYEKVLEAELKRWEAEIEELHAKSLKARDEAKLEYIRQIEELKVKAETVRGKLQQLSIAAEDAWKDIKAGAEEAAEDLGKALKNAFARFK